MCFVKLELVFSLLFKKCSLLKVMNSRLTLVLNSSCFSKISVYRGLFIDGNMAVA